MGVTLKGPVFIENPAEKIWWGVQDSTDAGHFLPW
jgi:hypothetical protein